MSALTVESRTEGSALRIGATVEVRFHETACLLLHDAGAMPNGATNVAVTVPIP
jgi:hypothetical protein